MPSLEREKITALTRKARVVREIWLRERKEQLASPIAASAEVRQRWVEPLREISLAPPARTLMVEGRSLNDAKYRELDEVNDD